MATLLGSQTTPLTITADDLFVLLEQDTIVTPSIAITVSGPTTANSKFYIMGDVIGFSRAFSVDAQSVDIVVADTGNLVSTFNTVTFSTVSGGSSLINHGTIRSFDGIGVLTPWTAQSLITVVNYGSIHGAESGVSMQQDGSMITNHGAISGFHGVSIEAANATFVNFGTVTAEPAGVIVGNVNRSAAIDTTTSALGTLIVNHGTIIGQDNGAFIALGAIRARASEQVINHGAIVGDVEFIGTSTTHANVYTAVGTGSVDGAVYGGNGNDSLTGGLADDRFYGGDQDDVLMGRGGDDLLFGDAGNDVIHGGNDDDQVHGGSGTDLLFGGMGDDTVNGDGDADTIHGMDGDDFLFGGTANDLVYGGGGDDLLDGGDGLDTLYGGAGDDTLAGGVSGDVLYGGAGNDLLSGQGGNDTLYGGSGDDTLIGGAGADVFIFGRHSGHDVISDFTPGSDRMDLSAFGFASVAEAKAAATNITGGVLFDFADVGGTSSIFVAGQTVNSLQSGDFIL